MLWFRWQGSSYNNSCMQVQHIFIDWPALSSQVHEYEWINRTNASQGYLLPDLTQRVGKDTKHEESSNSTKTVTTELSHGRVCASAASEYAASADNECAASANNDGAASADNRCASSAVCWLSFMQQQLSRWTVSSPPQLAALQRPLCSGLRPAFRPGRPADSSSSVQH